MNNKYELDQTVATDVENLLLTHPPIDHPTLFVVPGHATRLRVDQMQSPASGTLHRAKHVGIRHLVGDKALTLSRVFGQVKERAA